MDGHPTKRPTKGKGLPDRSLNIDLLLDVVDVGKGLLNLLQARGAGTVDLNSLGIDFVIVAYFTMMFTCKYAKEASC